MWTVVSTGLLCIVLVSQAVETRACDSPNSDSDATTPAPGPSPPSSQVFATRDGVRFRVEAVVNNLEIPWSLAFAPDGRLFVTERPGRVRIVDLSTFTSELALTLIGVYAQGEAGLLDWPSIHASQRTSSCISTTPPSRAAAESIGSNAIVKSADVSASGRSCSTEYRRQPFTTAAG